MALAALVLPKRWLPQLPEALDEALEALRHEQERMVALVRATRPQEGSDEEQRAFQHLMRLILPVDLELLEAFRSAVDTGLKELLSEEKATQDAERQLALRHIEQAVNTLAVVMESWGAALGEVPEASWKLARQQIVDALAGGQLPPLSKEDRTFLRFELDLTMALAALDGPLDDLTYWAHRAVTGARRVQALSTPKLMARWRGELARLRAKASWVDWDDREVQRELEPWPDDSKSR